jgi:hypothetical protein
MPGADKKAIGGSAWESKGYTFAKPIEIINYISIYLSSVVVL